MSLEMNVPRTEEQLSYVLAERPPGWEYLVFAGALILELEPLESRYEDYKLGYAPRLGRFIYEAEFFEYFQAQLSESMALINGFSLVFNEKIMKAAFGPTGVAGNSARLLHLAKRIIGTYDELLRWVERLRGTSVPDRYSPLIAILAKWNDQPIEEIRRFVRYYAESVERIPDATVNGTPVLIDCHVTFSIPAELSKAFRDEMERLEAELL
jgi:hypothetical protein